MLEDFKQFNFKDIKFKTDCFGMDLTESVKLLESYLQGLNKVFENKQTDFVNLCVYTYKLYELFKDYSKTWYGRISTEYDTYTYDKIMSSFGIDETYASKLRSCFEKYIMLVENVYYLKAYFFGFSPTKLIELLPVPIEQLRLDISNNVLSSEMTCSKVREYVKNWKNIQKQNKKLFEEKEDKLSEEDEYNPDEIEEAYNPKNHYEFEYFEKKSKAQLLNIVMELQKEYEKLLLEKSKKKNTSNKS